MQAAGTGLGRGGEAPKSQSLGARGGLAGAVSADTDLVAGWGAGRWASARPRRTLDARTRTGQADSEWDGATANWGAASDGRGAARGAAAHWGLGRDARRAVTRSAVDALLAQDLGSSKKLMGLRPEPWPRRPWARVRPW
jgi:hypothetical protein